MWLALALILLATLLVRLHLLAIPLERDEGEYAYAGQLILQGIPPYKLAYNMKLPGIYAAYAAIMAVFGQSATGIHLGLLLVNLLTIVLVFLIARRFLAPLGAVTAGGIYALLSASPSVLGPMGHATHFVLLFALAGIWGLSCSLDGEQRVALFLSGLCLGTGILMKQCGSLFPVFGAALLLHRTCCDRPIPWKRRALQGALYAAGVILPYLATCAVLAAAGVFGKFWFWTVSYASQYASELSFADGMEVLKSYALRSAVGDNLPLWLLAGLGLLGTLRRAGSGREKSLFLWGFALFSFLAVCPGFWFRNHYFILVLPALSLLCGDLIQTLWDVLRRRGPLVAGTAVGMTLLLAAGYPVCAQARFFFVLSPEQASRQMYGANPFVESLPVARYLASHTAAQAHIAVIGSEPQLYFYAKRRSCTGHIYTYGMMEEQQYAEHMQREMIAEIEAGRPEYIVLVNVPTSWLPRDKSSRTIFQWAGDYCSRSYDLVGIVDISPTGESCYRWEAQTAGGPRSEFNLLVMKRKLETAVAPRTG